MQRPVPLSLSLAVTFALAAAAGQVGIPGAGGTLFVTERQLGSVTAFDSATGEPVWTTMGGAAPIGITQPHGTDKVYSSDEGSNRMSVLDRATGSLIRTIAMGPLPHHLMASRNGEFIYGGEFGHNQIGVVDTSLDMRVAARADLVARHRDVRGSDREHSGAHDDGSSLAVCGRQVLVCCRREPGRRRRHRQPHGGRHRRLSLPEPAGWISPAWRLLPAQERLVGRSLPGPRRKGSRVRRDAFSAESAKIAEDA